AHRLDRLIQDVLNYSKIVKAQIVVEPLDLDRLTRDLILTYPDWQPPKAEIQIEGTLPNVLGNEAFLTQCISNLVSNAIKFVAPCTAPRIRIRAEEITARRAGSKNMDDGKLDSCIYFSPCANRLLALPVFRMYLNDKFIGI